MIAFSTDSTVAGRGVYLLSFLPESDVNRIVDYAASTGKRSFAALVPQSAYGNVAEAAFTQAVARRGARVVALERYGDPSQLQQPARNVAQALAGADALFLPDDGSGSVIGRGRGADAGGRQSAARAVARHRTMGKSTHLRDRRRCRAGFTRHPTLRASAASRPDIARASGRTRCVRRRSPTTPSRSSRRW